MTQLLALGADPNLKAMCVDGKEDRSCHKWYNSTYRILSHPVASPFSRFLGHALEAASSVCDPRDSAKFKYLPKLILTFLAYHADLASHAYLPLRFYMRGRQLEVNQYEFYGSSQHLSDSEPYCIALP